MNVSHPEENFTYTRTSVPLSSSSTDLAEYVLSRKQHSCFWVFYFPYLHLFADFQHATQPSSLKAFFSNFQDSGFLWNSKCHQWFLVRKLLKKKTSCFHSTSNTILPMIFVSDKIPLTTEYLDSSQGGSEIAPAAKVKSIQWVCVFYMTVAFITFKQWFVGKANNLPSGMKCPSGWFGDG